VSDTSGALSPLIIARSLISRFDHRFTDFMKRGKKKRKKEKKKIRVVSTMKVHHPRMHIAGAYLLLFRGKLN